MRVALWDGEELHGGRFLFRIMKSAFSIFEVPKSGFFVKQLPKRGIKSRGKHPT
jgi:hypothetical protein